ncbi:MAG: hydantoinase/oxoprolinase family protein [Firmicutes bacterium]|nr:hydantoinase/oxoprolinase family protein [Bacillota bacterium]
MAAFMVGIDVGGTNTDAVLLRGAEVEALIKVPTDPSDLLGSTTLALHKVLEHYKEAKPVKLHLSTTLSTNAIVEGRGSPTQVVTVPGPGVNLKSLDFPFTLVELDGYIDHRGREISPLQLEQVSRLRNVLGESGEALAIVGKFSQRNPAHEQSLKEEIAKWHKGIITLGHRLSGRANFPRRIVTAYLNSSIARQQLEFLRVWQKVQGSAIGEILILKADGGTMTLEDSAERPIESILSGPAASIMGVKALAQCAEANFLIVDIGGTTTDLAAVVDGEVLFERDGATISGYKTLVPAVLARSTGLGGDSRIRYEAGTGIVIGPERAGTPVCLGGEHLTPTDAAAALGLASVGSQEAARQAWRDWGESLGLSGEKLASEVFQAFVNQLRRLVEDFYTELESMPLYTIREVLDPPRLRPAAVVGLGAPAPVFIPALANNMGLPWEVLPFASGANAIGAAAARATVGVTLQADTQLGKVTIPEMGYQGDLHRPLFFDLGKARSLAEEKTREYAESLGYDASGEVYIVEEESFQMVRGFRTVGQTHMVRTQLRPEVCRVRGEDG